MALAVLALLASAQVASAMAQPELFTTMPTDGAAYPWPFPDGLLHPPVHALGLEGKPTPPPAPPAITFGLMFGNSMVLQVRRTNYINALSDIARLVTAFFVTACTKRNGSAVQACVVNYGLRVACLSLQSAPATAAVYGTVRTTMTHSMSSFKGAPIVQVHVSSNTGVDYTVAGAVDGAGNWKATLHPGAVGGSYMITVTMGVLKANITDATFGDVWYCSGQSNMVRVFTVWPPPRHRRFGQF